MSAKTHCQAAVQCLCLKEVYGTNVADEEGMPHKELSETTPPAERRHIAQEFRNIEE